MLHRHRFSQATLYRITPLCSGERSESGAERRELPQIVIFRQAQFHHTNFQYSGSANWRFAEIGP